MVLRKTVGKGKQRKQQKTLVYSILPGQIRGRERSGKVGKSQKNLLFNKFTVVGKGRVIF